MRKRPTYRKNGETVDGSNPYKNDPERPLNQRAVGSTPTRPPNFSTTSESCSRFCQLGYKSWCQVFPIAGPAHLQTTGKPLRTSVWISPHSLSSYDQL